MATTDTAYPPSRNRPRGENRRVREQRQNTYTTERGPAPKAAETPAVSGKLLLGALVAGGLFAWFKASASDAGTGTSPAPATGSGAATGLPTGTNTGTTTAPVSSTGGTTMKPLPELIPYLSPLRHVFIQSFNGETLYERLRQEGGVPHGYGLPSTAITMASNGEFIGYLTGKSFQPSPSYPRMVQVYCKLTGGFVYNFWVDAGEVVVFGDADAKAYYARGIGKVMSTATAQAIKTYFLSRYNA